jgi:hypothetical protein
MINLMIALLIAGFACYGFYIFLVKIIPARKKGEKIVK